MPYTAKQVKTIPTRRKHRAGKVNCMAALHTKKKKCPLQHNLRALQRAVIYYINIRI